MRKLLQPSQFRRFKNARPRYSRKQVLAGGVLTAVVVTYLFLSVIVTYFVNNTIKRVGEYRGRVEKISVNLFRGAYAIDDIVLEKMSGEAVLPFFTAKRIDFNVEWRALLRGRLAGEVEFHEPSVHFVRSRDPDVDQTDVKKTDWKKNLEELSPLSINRIRIHDGSIHFKDLETDPLIDVYLSKIEAEATNLTNVRDVKQILKSTIAANGQAMEAGSFKVFLSLEPFAEKPTFETKNYLEVSLPEINDFLKHYLAVEANDGELNIYLEGAAGEGKFKGYVKPLMDEIVTEDMDIDAQNPGEILKGTFVQISTALFKNRQKNDIATKVDFEGSFDGPDVDLIGAVYNFFRNAFFKGIMPGFEGSAEVTQRGDLVDEKGEPVDAPDGPPPENSRPLIQKMM